MIKNIMKFFTLFSISLLLISCEGERRVDGEMAFDSNSLMNMAESFLTAGDYGNAMRLYQRAANENPKHVASRLGLAKTYQALGATDAAINFYDQVLRLDPNNMDAKMGSGQMLITRNRPKDAIPYLTDILKQDPNNYRLYNMLGLAHDLMGDQEEAQMNYGRGLELETDNVSLLNNLALSFAFQNQYAPAIRLLGKAINLDYSVTKAQQNLVLVYVLSGEEEAARKIGAAIMTDEEMINNIRHYQWVKTLSPGERAQAIFLGLKSFPEKETMVTPNKSEVKSAEKENTVIDPKKQQLMDVLKGEGTASSQAVKNKTEEKPPQIQKKAPEAKDQTPEKSQKTMASPFKKVYRVQLGSYPTLKLADKGWQKIKRRSKGQLDPYESLVKLVTLANGKTLFRLFVGGIEERSMAQTTCDALREQKIDCFVLKTNKN